MKRIFVIGLLLTGLLFSCNKDDGNKDTQLKDGEEFTQKEICLELVFPITFIMPDGSTITGENREEVGTAIKADAQLVSRFDANEYTICTLSCKITDDTRELLSCEMNLFIREVK